VKTSYFFLAILAGVSLLAFQHAVQDAPALALFVRFFGLAAFFLLSAALMIGPAAVLWPKHFANLIEARRSVGVSAFVFLVPHFFLTISMYFKWNFTPVFGLPQLLAGLVAGIIVLALALTSTDWAARTLGNNWKWLHRLVYLAFLLSLYHGIVQIQKFGLDKAGGMNLAQVAVLAVAGVAVILQVAGFITQRKRVAAAKAQANAAAPPAQAQPQQQAQNPQQGQSG